LSNFLAIGAVTALLRDLLYEGLVRQHVVGTLDADHVGALPPDLIEKVTNGKPRLNLFLHRVSPNTGWSNVGYPAFDGRGTRVGNPPLALDLHYLLTAQGSDDFHAEVLLGCAMQLLHETPVLTRSTIRQKQATWSAGNDDLLRALATAELSDQAEQIKITPEAMTPEEVSRLWAAFQAHYRPAAAYRVTVVLIESDHARKSPLPVLTIGPADRGVFSQPNTAPSTPTLVAVMPPDKQPYARLEDDLVLEGHRLDGITLMDEDSGVAIESITVSFSDPRRPRTLKADPREGNMASQMAVRLSTAIEQDAPGRSPEKRWAAGIYGVSVLFRRSGEDSDRATNELPFALAPTIVLPIRATREADKVTFVVKCKPEVRWDQRASLLVGNVEIPAEAGAIKDAAEAVARVAESAFDNPSATKDDVKDAARNEANRIADDQDRTQEAKDAAEAVAKAAEDEAGNPNATKDSVKRAVLDQAGQTDTLTFGPRAIDPDDYFVRLRIDKVESVHIDRTAKPPEFDQSQQVTVP
jgi:Pvc16 N-terminal domain